MAKLSFNYGAMNSGKSVNLIREAHQYQEKDLPIVLIKPAVDTKVPTDISSRIGLTAMADILATPEMDVRAQTKQFMADKAIEMLHCAFVDEAQFLTVEQIDQLYDMAKIDDISVMAYGLRSDFRRQAFPASARLMVLADRFNKIATMCECGSQAEFNTRFVDGNFTLSGDQVAIDGAGAVTYDSHCGYCRLQMEKGADSGE